MFSKTDRRTDGFFGFWNLEDCLIAEIVLILERN